MMLVLGWVIVFAGVQGWCLSEKQQCWQWCRAGVVSTSRATMVAITPARLYFSPLSNMEMCPAVAARRRQVTNCGNKEEIASNKQLHGGQQGSAKLVFSDEEGQVTQVWSTRLDARLPYMGGSSLNGSTLDTSSCRQEKKLLHWHWFKESLELYMRRFPAYSSDLRKW